MSMRTIKIHRLTRGILVALGALALASEAAAQSLDQAPPTHPGARAQISPPPLAPRAIWQPPANAIYDNGALANGNAPACSGDTGNASILQNTTLAMGTYGAGHAVSSGFRVADDFTVPTGQTWDVDSAYFFAYQTGSGNTSTINAVNVRIWSGAPGTGTIVCGDTTTNLLSSTSFSGLFRTLESAPDCTRPLMVQEVNLSSCPPLVAGNYWVDWQTGGTGASGPWAPPIAIAGQATTGNSQQFDPATSAWSNLVDGGSATPQGLPFVLVGPAGAALSVDTADAVVVDTCSANPDQNNNVVEPGESVTVSVPVSATAGNFTGVTASLGLAPVGIDYVTSNVSLGTINAGGQATANFEIIVQPGFACLDSFELPINVTSAEGSASGLIDIDVGQSAVIEPTDTPVSIPDNSPSTGGSSVIAVTQDVSLTGLQVRVSITHTWVGDLTLRLKSPAGTEITLLDRPGVPASSTVGCNNNNINATFADGQPNPEAICDAAGSAASWPVTSAGPVQPLSTFNGESTLGNWTLTVTDSAGGDTGTIVDWELIATPAFQGICEVCAGNDIIFRDGFDGAD